MVGDTIALLAARLRDDPVAEMRLVSDWAAQGAPGDLRTFLAGCDSRGDALAEAIDRRNDAMRRAVALRWPNLPSSSAATRLWRELDRYRAGGWQSDRKGSNPHAAGSFRHELFEALAARPSVLGEKQIGRILRAPRLT